MRRSSDSPAAPTRHPPKLRNLIMVHSPSKELTQGLHYPTYLNSTKIYGCQKCKTHLAINEDLVSKVPTSRTPQLTSHFEVNTAKHFSSPKCKAGVREALTVG
jgi:hypothetical protein